MRNGFDAVCLDRMEGPFPIRSFTGDIGGKVPLGIGQGSLAILSYPAGRRARSRDPLQRSRACSIAASSTRSGLRMQIENVPQARAWASLNTGLIPGMAGVGVPILDAEGRAVAALSIGTLAERLEGDRCRWWLI